MIKKSNGYFFGLFHKLTINLEHKLINYVQMPLFIACMECYMYVYINSYVQEENLYWTFKVLVLNYASLKFIILLNYAE